jgi:hypothetical protein
VYFLYIEVLLQMGRSDYTEGGTSAKEGYVRDNNDGLRGGVTMNYRSMSDAISDPILASAMLVSHLLDGLPMIYVLLPDNLFNPFLLRMVLKLSMTGHTSIALSVVLNTFLLGVF